MAVQAFLSGKLQVVVDGGESLRAREIAQQLGRLGLLVEVTARGIWMPVRGDDAVFADDLPCFIGPRGGVMIWADDKRVRCKPAHRSPHCTNNGEFLITAKEDR